MDSELKTLIGKLNPTCHQGLEEAAGLCVAQTNYAVEIEHLLLKLLEGSDTDLHRLLRYYEISATDLETELTQAIDRLKRGNTRTPSLSPHILSLLQEAWVFSSLQFKESQIRSASLLLALLNHNLLRGIALESSRSLRRIPRQTLKKDAFEIIRGSKEDSNGYTPIPGDDSNEVSNDSNGRKGTPRVTKTPALDQFTINLTQQARAGKIDPITGRDFEIRQVVDILTRRRQNNPILVGEAGVGKTAIVEGFAQRIVDEDVPPPLKNICVRILDLGLLQAGAGVRGEFENRLKSVIKEVRASVQPIILFIDEAHTMIGTGASTGQGDAANLLKPALARGELRTIAATTWSEYKKYFEKDPALTRRFQVVKVDEPDEPTAVQMLRGTVAHLERHHKVRILDEAVKEAVRLSHRFISGRQLPDKAISVLDTASARVALGQNGTPAPMEDTLKTIQQMELELEILKREQSTGTDHEDRIRHLSRQLKKKEAEKRNLDHKWKKENDLVQKIHDLQKELEGEDALKPAHRKALHGKLGRNKNRLEKVQDALPLVPVCVDANAIAMVISGWTGIPVGKMMTDDIEQVLALKDNLEERVVGQSQALDTICQRIRTSKASMDDPGKPVGVFLLLGPSGIGKTETAHALADLLYGGEKNMIRVNMSEFQEAHTVSGLKGSPPGYVGFGQGGVLTEAVRRTPYSVVLLDEVEKAHPDVMELFYQVFDKGIMEDAEGLEIDFKNTIILLTSNLGTDEIMAFTKKFGQRKDSKILVDQLRPVLLKRFPPAFLGRLFITPYYPLGGQEMKNIVQLKLEKIKTRFLENHNAELVFAKDLAAAIALRCKEVESGARNIDHILTQSFLPELSEEVLEWMAEGKTFTRVRASLDRSGKFKFKFRG